LKPRLPPVQTDVAFQGIACSLSCLLATLPPRNHRFGMTNLKRLLIATILFTGSSSLISAEQRVERVDIKRSLEYLLFLPQQYERSQSWPLIVFLHGAGERGSNIERVKKHGPPKIVQTKPGFEFIVVSPQCPANQRWNAPDVMALVQHIKSSYQVDQERIYLTGLSMGGYGTWDTAARYPYEFAAIAPICGGGNPRSARRISHLPTWVFHGAKDRIVPLSESQAMVAGMEKAGGAPKLTIYPEKDHDSWTASYANPELYRWFLKHKKQPRPERRRR